MLACYATTLILQALDERERAGARELHAKLSNFVEAASQASSISEAEVAIPQPLHQVGNVPVAWGRRVYQNRLLELNFLRSPVAATVVAVAAWRLLICAFGLWMMSLSCLSIRSQIHRRRAQSRANARILEVPLAANWGEEGRDDNRVCNTRLLWMRLALPPTQVAVITFFASIVLYFGSPDDAFFLLVAIGKTRIVKPARERCRTQPDTRHLVWT